MASDFASGAASGAATGTAIMPGWGTAIGAAIGGISSLLGSKAAKKAAEEQRRKLAEAQGIERDVYGQAQAINQPYMGLGEYSANALRSGLGGDLTRQFSQADFEQDPGYQFRMDQGRRALDASASARGGLFSGDAGKALQRYGQDYGSQEWGRAYDRFTGNQQRNYNMLLGGAGIGQNAVGQVGAAGQNFAGRMGGLLTGQGNAAAAGTIGSANALTGGLQTAYNAYNDQQVLNEIRRRNDLEEARRQRTGYGGGNYGWAPTYSGFAGYDSGSGGV